MTFGLVTLAYNEERFIRPFLEHIPEWVDERIVLVSTKPWNGVLDASDNTADIARSAGATVIERHWVSEEEQRNTGQALLSDCDWVIVLDPDEYLDNTGWESLKSLLIHPTQDAYVVEGQYTYWKNGYVANPPKDYQQLILVKPHIQFVDKRVINSSYGIAPVWLHHFSWARTDEEVWKKISHYAHANDFDIEKWYNEVWLKWKPGVKDVHPVTPETLHELIPANLPKELEKLSLWP